MLYLICSVVAFLPTGEEPQHCHDYNGTSVLKMHIHLDELALPGFSGQGGSTNTLKSIMTWFGEIFDDINKELQPHGVQFHCDFSELPTTKYPFTYDKIKCIETNPPGARSVIADTVFKQKYLNNYGNRLIVFFCPNNTTSMLKGHVKNGDCNNTLGYLFGPLLVLKQTIRNSVIKAVFGKSSEDTNFNSQVCKIANKCVNGKKSLFGQYIGDLKAVRHISNEEYIIPNNERLNEHDLYDDIYVEKYDNSLV
ncbi:hypothetical protein BDAP_001743 [Binucleata daphniae]